MKERIESFPSSLSAPEALRWPSFSLACSMSSSGSDGNMAVIHLCFPLLGRGEKVTVTSPPAKDAPPPFPVGTHSTIVVTHSVCDLRRIWCLSCRPSHSCKWKMKPEMPCSFWLRSFTFSSPILACTNTMNFHVLQQQQQRWRFVSKIFLHIIITSWRVSKATVCWWFKWACGFQTIAIIITLLLL